MAATTDIMVRFWGVRGSIPCPGPNTVKYGGNTPCIELRFGPDRLIILDAGSGIRELGNALMAEQRGKPLETELYLTHTHWDHIMGFPFFVPIYLPTTRLTVYGPVTYEAEGLETIVGGQLSYRYFPVRTAELAADIRYVHLKEERRDLGDGIILTTKYLNHPILCLGYRFEYQGKVVCTAYDTEPYRNLFCTDPNDPAYDETMAEEGDRVAMEQNRLLEEFFAGADLLIYDAQYTEEEYRSGKLGWGHSTFEWAVAAAQRADVRRLVLFHHDPLRTDGQLDELADTWCGGNTSCEVFIAREGQVFDL